MEDRTLLDAGFLDPTFGTGGRVLTDFTGPTDNLALAAALQPDGKILALGHLASSGTADLALARYNPDGSLDVTFGGSGRVRTDFAFPRSGDLPVGLLVQPDGTILVAGLPKISATGPGVNLAMARFTAGGTLDISFGTGGKVLREVTREAVAAADLKFQADGHIVVVTLPTGTQPRPTLIRYNPDGTRDTEFGTNGVGDLQITFEGQLIPQSMTLVPQADGKIIFVSTSGWIHHLYRLNANGTRDQSFFPGGGFMGATADPTVLTAALQSDGKILVAGSGSTDFLVHRMTPTGGFDSFGSFGHVHTDFGGYDKARSVLQQADGKILLAGVTTNVLQQTSQFALARLNSNGDLDAMFGTGGKVVTEFSPGRNEAYSVLLQSDGKIVLVGTAPGSGADFALARYTTSGTLDTTFGTGGKVTTDFVSSLGDAARAVAVQSDGKIVVAGSASNGTTGDFALARYLATGALDTGFGVGGRVVTSFGGIGGANAVAVQSDGRIVAAGTGGTGFALARYLPDGRLDDSFGTGGKVSFTFPIGIIGGTAVAFAVALQPDGKIVASGGCGVSPALARLNPDGTFDATFGDNGRIGSCSAGGHTFVTSTRVALQPNGKIVTAVAFVGSGRRIFLKRYNVDGSVDAGFGTGGEVTTGLLPVLAETGLGLRLQQDGKILVGGASVTTFVSQIGALYGFGVVRYNEDGTRDTTFGNGGGVVVDFGGSVSTADLAVQADGKIVAVGPVNEVGGTGFTGMIVTRLLPNGKLNTSLGVAGKVEAVVKSSASPAAQAAFQSDGKLVVVGTATDTGTGSDFLLTRFDLNDTFTTENQRYVGQLYLNLLQRSVEPAGLSVWVGVLERGELTRAQVAQAIAGSDEYRTVTVRNLYRSLLNREADPGGLGAFTAALRAGVSVGQVKAAMLGSEEYFQNRTDRTNNGFLTSLYRDVLGRGVDPLGQQLFGQALAAGMPRGTVALIVVSSRESLERIVQGWYRQYLRRSADPGGLNAFAGFLQAGGREELAAAAFLSSGEFGAGL